MMTIDPLTAWWLNAAVFIVFGVAVMLAGVTLLRRFEPQPVGQSRAVVGWSVLLIIGGAFVAALPMIFPALSHFIPDLLSI